MLGQGGVCHLVTAAATWPTLIIHPHARAQFSVQLSRLWTLILKLETKDYIAALVGAFSVIVITKVDLRIQL